MPGGRPPVLTADQVWEIRYAYAHNEKSTYQLADEYECSRATISRIVRYIGYPEVPDREPLPPRQLVPDYSKLTSEDVRAIRYLRTREGYSYNALADMFEIHKDTIGRVVRGVTWKDAI